MRLKLALAVLFAAGLGASFALAADSPAPSVVLCHRVAKPTAHWLRVTVAVPVARVRMLRGDVWLKDPKWTCATAAARHVRLKPVTMGTTQGQPLPTKPTYT